MEPSTPPPIQIQAAPAASGIQGNEKIWSMFSHLSVFLGIGIFLVPFVVYLAMKNESAYVAANAREALNFHISLVIYALCCLPLCLIFIGVFLLMALGVAMYILAVVAAIKAADGGCYRYPLTIRLVQ